MDSRPLMIISLSCKCNLNIRFNIWLNNVSDDMAISDAKAFVEEARLMPGNEEVSILRFNIY